MLPQRICPVRLVVGAFLVLPIRVRAAFALSVAPAPRRTLTYCAAVKVSAARPFRSCAVELTPRS